jgi:hypothetical protein
MQVALTQPPSYQMPLPRMLGEARKPDYVEIRLLKQCESLLDAIHLCIQLSRYKHYTIAEKLGIDRGHWTRMMQGQAHFPTNKMKSLMELCGNYAPLQWLAQSMGQELAVDQIQLRKQRALRELEEIQALEAA